MKFAQFSYDAALIASTGQYDRLLKLWRRLNFGTEDVTFDVSYLSHPATVTNVHWRRPHHREQTIENVLYTICADDKIRVWAAMDRHNPVSVLQLWGEIDMSVSIQPRVPSEAGIAKRRYGFIIDSRDFAVATEHAVQRGTNEDSKSNALEHLVEIATKNPEICVVLDGRGHMSAWGLENLGHTARSPSDIFNVVHVENLGLSFPYDVLPEENYIQFYNFSGGVSKDSFTLLAHYFDGRIEWFDSKVDTFFDPAQRKNRLSSHGIWSGHSGSIKKIVRNPSGGMLVSRTDDNKAMIWRQRKSTSGSVLVRQSDLFSDIHIHRTCLLGDGTFLVNLHHNSISLWDTRPNHAIKVCSCKFRLTSKPLCILHVPVADESNMATYVVSIGADMNGVAWEIITSNEESAADGTAQSKRGPIMQQFCTFNLGLDEDIAYIMPVDPAGAPVKTSGFLDLFATDIALSYTHTGVIRTWAAKVDKQNRKIDWLATSVVETGISYPSLASGASIRKAAMVDQNRTQLTIWDTNGAHLEFEESFSQQDIIQDLDWTSTPDAQSILAVGFPHKVIFLSQLRYDYLDAGPSWTQIREVRTRELTPHPIGDSCWLGNGNLVVGTGNQLFIYDKHVEIGHRAIAGLRFSSYNTAYVDLFDVVSRLNGPLPVFHPQFLAQCILCGKVNLVHLILSRLHRKLKFFTEGDELDAFLEIPLEEFYMEADVRLPYSTLLRRCWIKLIITIGTPKFFVEKGTAIIHRLPG